MKHVHLYIADKDDTLQDVINKINNDSRVNVTASLMKQQNNFQLRLIIQNLG